MDIEDIILYIGIGIVLGIIILATLIHDNIIDSDLLDSMCKDRLGDNYKFDELYRDDNSIQHIKCVKEEKYQLDGSNNNIIKGD